ncbi:cadherin domain-containing protein [Uliginosibacterium sp. TH139]|uniref:cadherin domain-containing protein n=1 Tax=Uliginosibacterium sp. TH139 TaxID=2067453 RepID=UPI000C7ACBAD|nr:cadherin domain-containing protein [Uliginosibacterium sp. TH139]PLK49628.1 hypothetical protein C0V76_04140 [Uliginosibacterium sp. TH139]
MWLPPLLRQLLGRTPARPARARPQRAVFEEIEARLLYSADFAPGISELAPVAEIRLAEPDEDASATTQSSQSSHALIFVDASIEDVANLQADILRAQPDAEIIFLAADRNGITQISEALQGRTGISAIHLLVHGGDGSLQLGNTLLDASSLARYSEALAGWQGALSAEADLLIYGCNFTAGEAGLQMADALARLTGADVASSDDLTGSSATGGDWVLEQHTGRIETASLLGTGTELAWSGTLNIVTGTTSTATTDTIGATSLTFSHTVDAGSNSLLIVEYSTRGTTSPASITWNGMALTRLDTVSNVDVVTTEIWYLKNPGAGTANIVVTMPGPAKEFSVGATTFLNVDQSSTFGTVAKATGIGSTASVNVSSASGDLVIDSLATRQQTGSPTLGAGQSQLWTNSPGIGSAEPRGAGSTEAGAASVSMSWTLTDSWEWASLGVSLNAAPNTTPTLNAPASYVATEQISLDLQGTGITVADVDGDVLTVTISTPSNNSQFTAAVGSTGVSVVSGNGSKSLVVSGTASQLNNFFAGNGSATLSFRQAGDTPTASLTMTLSVSDGVASSNTSSTITITAVNDPPVLGTPTSISVTEDLATALTGITVADNDAASNPLILTFTVGSGSLSATSGSGVTVGGSATALTLTGTVSSLNSFIAAGSLSYTTATNSTSSITLGVSVSDQGYSGSGGTQTASANITLTVSAVNDAPVITSNSGGSTASLSVAENTSAVTTLSATDVDSASLSYAITGGADAARFTINSSTGALVFASAPNYEAPNDSDANNSYVVIVQVSDGSGGTDTQTLTVTVTNTNEAPVITSNGAGATATINVTENATAVTTATASDEDAGATRTWSITGGADAGKFTINSSTGALTFSVAPNYEAPTDADANNSYIVSVQVSDGSLTDSQNITVTVTNANEAPVIGSNGGGATAAVSVSENTSAVTTATASDADAGATQTWSISGGADAAKFTINSSTGVLTFIAAPDYETPTDSGANNVYDVVVQVSDGSLTDTQAIAVTVTNSNEAPVISSNGGGATASTSVAENSGAVTTVSATDSDAASTLSYSISGGADAAKFTINSSTGLLTFIAAPDYENPSDSGANNVYDVIVQVSDGSLTDTQAIAITITAVNDGTPTLTSHGGGTSASISVAENTSAVTTLTATDSDLPAQTLTYSITGGTDAAFFTINSSTGELSFSTARNYESAADANGNNVYLVVVQVSDGTNTDSQSLSVSITDVDEFDVGAISDSNASANSVPEGVNGATVGITAHATDADGSSNTVTYSLSSNPGNLFAVDASSGVVTVASGANLNYEAATSHSITVQATSADGSSSSQSFTISVSDVDEFDVSSVSDGNGGANTVAENAANGTAVGITASATDADGSNSSISYSLSDSAGGRFAINSSSGLVSVADGSQLNYEATTSHSIIVRATSADGSYSEQGFTISLSDADEFDVGALTDSDPASNEISEFTSNGATVGITAQASDADATNNSISYSLIDSAGSRFAIDTTTGVVTVADASRLDFETDGSHTIIVRASSADGSHTDQSFVITLLNAQEGGVGAIRDGDAGVENVIENAGSGTLVGITAQASDPDGDPITYSLSSDAAGRFSIDTSSGVVSVSAFGGTPGELDREQAASYTITVKASSSDGSFTERNFTITLGDVDESDVGAISDSNASADSITENAANGSRVGITALASDADATTNSISYSLSSNPGNIFSIDADTGVISVADGSQLDYETATSHAITVLATSADGSTRSQVFTIAVVNLNDNTPVITSNGAGAVAAINLAENSSAVTTVTASDGDAGSTLSYSITGGADAALFSIDSNSGALTFLAAPDRELAGDANGDHVYLVDIQVSDGDRTDSQNLAILITDVDEYDVGTITDSNTGSNTISEVVANGSSVGITALASDADATSNTITYSLSNSAGGIFSIDSGGVVRVADQNQINYESNTSHAIVVRATSADGSFSEQGFTINISDINEFDISALTDGNGAANVVAENATNGSLVGITAQASDADGSNNSISYALTDNADGRFAIDASTGVVSVLDGSRLDYESATSYAITVRANSSDGSSSSTSFTITLTDADEFDVSAPVDFNLASNLVTENAANGSLVGITARALDQDASNNSISYSLSDDAGGLFTIDASTGVVTVANGAGLDFETTSSHNITVQASSADGSSSSASFTIHLADANEFSISAVTDSNGALNQITEDAANGTVVGITANASDADASSNTINYSLSDDAGGRFAIDATTGLVSVADSALLDYESATSHTITVLATSADGSTSSQSFTIALTDIDEFNVGAISDSNAAANSINEHAATGSAIGVTAHASDADGSNNSISYALTSDAGGLFSIDASTGVVSVANSAGLDFELASSHSITVLATSSDGSTSSQSFIITLTDSNDNAPTITSEGGGATASLATAENNTAVTTIVATDSDASSSISYSIIGGTDAARFSIDASTGVLRFIAAPDAETPIDADHNNVYEVIVQASDGLNTDSQSLSVSVADVDEFNVGSITDTDPASNSISENAAANSTVGISTFASDADASNNGVSYTLLDNAGGRFSITSDGGVIRVANPALIDFETASSHTVTVRATSADGSTSTQNFVITILDVDEFDVTQPNDSDASPNSISEAASNGSVVGVTAHASDADGSNNAITYSLTSDAGGLFTIDASTGVVTLANASLLDYESASSHFVSVLVSSADGSSSTRAFVITVADADEFDVSPLTDTDARANSLTENAANGTAVGITASASDADGSNNAITYTLSNDAGGRFAIDATSGVVTVANSSLIDFESASSHSITVLATSADGSSSSQSYTINLADSDEFDLGAVTDSNAAANLVSENAASGSPVGLSASATDADASHNSVSYSLSDDAGGRFAIDAVSGVISVANGALLDFEAASRHTITVLATSADGSSSSQSFTIQLADVDEFDIGPLSDSNATANSVNENAGAGTSVGITANAVDADASDSIRYSLSDDAGGRFAIDATNGVVSVANAALLDFESASSFSITVIARSSDGSASSQAFTISLVNINEAPGITAPASASGLAGSSLPLAGVSLSDPEGNISEVSLSVDQGSLSVSLSGSARIAAGANGSSQLTLSGSQSDLNTTLASLRYQASSSFAGEASLSLSTTDAGGLSSNTSLLLQLVSIVTDPAAQAPVTDPEPPQIITPEPVVPDEAAPPPEPIPLPSGSAALSDGGSAVIEITPDDEQAYQLLNPLAANNIEEPANFALLGGEDVLALLRRIIQNEPSGHGAVVSETLFVATPSPTDKLDQLLRLSPSQAGQAAAAALTAGVVWWAGRATGLITALMASVPAWRTVDPLPILGRNRKRAVEEEEAETTTLGLEPEPLQPRRGEPLLMMDITD